MKKGFTLICNDCGNELLINKDGGDFGDWTYEYDKEKRSDISVENLSLSEAVEIICKCGNYVTQDERLESCYRD